MGWLYSADWAFIASVTGVFIGAASFVVAFLQLRFQWIDRRVAAPSHPSWFKPAVFFSIAVPVFLVCIFIWAMSSWSPARSKALEQTTAASTVDPQPSLPVRARLEILGVELSPPVKNALVQIKAFVGEDTLLFPSTGTRNWLPVSGAFNDQTAIFFTNPRLTIQFEVDLADGSSNEQATLLSSERISYKGGNVRAFYTLDGPDSAASNASGIRKATITYRLQPAS